MAGVNWVAAPVSATTAPDKRRRMAQDGAVPLVEPRP